MKKAYIVVFLNVLLLSTLKGFGQISAQYQKAAEVYREYAAKTKCLERARYLVKMAEWNECMVDVLASRKTGCALAPTGTAPDCPADNGSDNTSKTNSKPQTVAGSTSNEDLDKSVKSLVEGISELAEIKLDENAKSDSWFLISGGSTLNGGTGPLAGTRTELGGFSGYFISFQSLERKGISFSSNINNIKSTYSHNFRAKGTDGSYRYYYGKTAIDMTSVDLSLGKDLTGTEGSFHFVPNVGANLIFNIDNNFTSSNYAGVTYEEDWNKDLFFSINAGVQMFWMFSKRFGLQGGGRYVYFPSTYGNVFKTNDFFHFNVGVAVRII